MEYDNLILPILFIIIFLLNGFKHTFEWSIYILIYVAIIAMLYYLTVVFFPEYGKWYLAGLLTLAAIYLEYNKNSSRKK